MSRWWRPLAVLTLGGLLTAIALSPADAQTRSLTLFNTHTQERATVTFKRNGRFDPAGLAELNRMLRDWRRNEQTRMAPELFDLIWEVYQEVGATEPIHIVSAYRSPATNNMLRSRSRGVAKVSQHMLGRAMDFFIPGVSLARLREVGLRKQIGGVGFYPGSGSPFVHMDVGSVRHWPRMTREQLARVFPDGKTVHVPTDGRPLARYDEALAEVERRKGRGSVARPGEADGDDDAPQNGGNLITALFGGFGVGSSSSEATPARPAERRPAELRQGPLPPSTADERPETVILAAPPRSTPAAAPAAPAPIPDPAPARPTPSVVAKAEPVAPAAGALLALPTPRPAPANRAPGSLVGTPAAPEQGWQVGAQPVTAAATALPSEPTPPADPRLLAALPAARPAVEVPIAALPERPDMPIPRERPTTGLVASADAARPVPNASAPTALAALAGGPSVDEQFRALGYAPPTDLPGAPAAGATLLAPGAPAMQAALNAMASAATGSTGARAGREARSSAPARGGDTLARLINRVSGVIPARLYDGSAIRARAFARLDHPDLDAIPQLMAKPRDAIAFGFGTDVYGTLRTDRFTGASIAVLPVVRMP